MIFCPSGIVHVASSSDEFLKRLHSLSFILIFEIDSLDQVVINTIQKCDQEKQKSLFEFECTYNMNMKRLRFSAQKISISIIKKCIISAFL